MSRTELSIDELTVKYPKVPRFIVLKIDAQRRGIKLTKSALDAVQVPLYRYGSHNSSQGPSSNLSSKGQENEEGPMQTSRRFGSWYPRKRETSRPPFEAEKKWRRDHLSTNTWTTRASRPRRLTS